MAHDVKFEGKKSRHPIRDLRVPSSGTLVSEGTSAINRQ